MKKKLIGPTNVEDGEIAAAAQSDVDNLPLAIKDLKYFQRTTPNTSIGGHLQP